MKKVFKLLLCCYRLIIEKRVIVNFILFNDRGFLRLRLNNVIDRFIYFGIDLLGVLVWVYCWGWEWCEVFIDLDLWIVLNFFLCGMFLDFFCFRI